MLVSKKNFRLIAIDLIKQTNLKDPQQISFIGRLLAARGATIFLSSENRKKLLLNSCKSLYTSYKNENTKDCKFVKQFWEWIFKICDKKGYVIDSDSKSGYLHEDPINFLSKSIESSLCDYSDAYILVRQNIIVTKTIAAAGDDPVKKTTTFYSYTSSI